MDVERMKKFVDLVRFYNTEPSKRVFRVDRDCYVVFTGFSAFDEKPFIRIGYSRYLSKYKKYISNVVITAGYLSSLREEIEQIEKDEFETNFIVPSSIYNVILKFIHPDVHHKVNVNVIDKSGEVKEASKVLREISEKYKSYVLLYDNGNFAITFSGKKIFDLFSVMTNDLTTAKILNLFSSKLYDILPMNVVIKLGGNYVVRVKGGELLIATDEFNEKEFLKCPIPLTTVKTLVSNEVIPLIDTIRLIYDRSRLRVFTNKETYEDFRKFTLGIKFVEVSDKINVINNVNISSYEGGKYYIPLVDKDGAERKLVFSKSEESNRIELENMEYLVLDDFSKGSLKYISTNLLLMDPSDKSFRNEFNSLRDFIKSNFGKRVSMADLEKEFETDNLRIMRDRKRLEELIDLYSEVARLKYSDKLDLLVKIEKLEGTQKEKEIKELAQKVSDEIPTVVETEVEDKVSKTKVEFPKFLGIDLRYLVIGGILLLLLVGAGVWFLKDGIFDIMSSEERRISEIVSTLENTYEPELTRIQNELGITITDYDIWVYVNKVAVINGYKPLTYKKPKRWEDPDWVYPGRKLKLVDGTEIVVRRGDNMWNISKRKIIEDYIKKNFVVTVKSRAGTNVYQVKRK